MRTRMPTLVTGLAALAALSACQQQPEQSSALPEGVSLIETLAADGEATGRAAEIVIPYAKYQLENGLTVILHEDSSDPLVHVDVTYHVGSAREEVGKSGFAHFFEHMMFQGSANVGDDQHFKIVSESGGTLNGSTNADRTNYYQTVPANQLEKTLWLEADRMGFLLQAVTQEKFEIQRDTVKNERAQRVDNRPYGLLYERVGEALFPPGHPYSWTTIGYVEDLDRVDVHDLKKFFLRWYGPNNATLTIGGRFDAAPTLAWVKKYFGSIPRGPAVDDVSIPPVELKEDRYISLEDDVALPRLHMAWPTVHRFHQDEALLDGLADVLGGGETSLLYKNMVKNGFAARASARHGCGELACRFTIDALLNPSSGKTLADLDRIARDSLLEFGASGASKDDVARTQGKVVSAMIYGLESVAGKVRQLAYYETIAGRADYIAEDIARYRELTTGLVMRGYWMYIEDKPAVVMSIVPKGRLDARAKEDTWRRPARELPEYAPVKPEDLAHRPAEDDFDRSVMPPAAPMATIAPPTVFRAELENGVRVLGARNEETPTTTIRLAIEAGQRDEPLAKLGLAALTAAMLNEATALSTTEQLSDRLQQLGSQVSFQAGDEYVTATVRSLTENLDETLAILAERLLQPKFDGADFERRKAQTLRAIEAAGKEAAVTADVVYQKLLLGQDNPIAYANSGTEETVQALSVADVKAFYAARYSPSVASVAAVSDLDQQALLGKLAVLEGWKGPPVERTPLAPFPDGAETKLYLVDKPGAAQSEIRIGKRSLPFDATGEHHRATLANYVLGGAFNSRINMNLREDKGYTYGARSSFQGRREYGLFTARSGVRTDATAASVVEFLSEIGGYAKDGITADELRFLRDAIGQSEARAYETPTQKVGFLTRILTYGLEPGFVEEQNKILAEISAEELNALAAKHMRPDDMIIVVVGDRSAVSQSLAKLGYEIVHLDADGDPVAASS